MRSIDLVARSCSASNIASFPQDQIVSNVFPSDRRHGSWIDGPEWSPARRRLGGVTGLSESRACGARGPAPGLRLGRSCAQAAAARRRRRRRGGAAAAAPLLIEGADGPPPPSHLLSAVLLSMVRLGFGARPRMLPLCGGGQRRKLTGPPARPRTRRAQSAGPQDRRRAGHRGSAESPDRAFRPAPDGRHAPPCDAAAAGETFRPARLADCLPYGRPSRP